MQSPFVPRISRLWVEISHFPFSTDPIGGVHWRDSGEGNIRPCLTVPLVKCHPGFGTRSGIGKNSVRGAFKLAHAAINTDIGIDRKHVFSLMKTIDRTDLHAIHKFTSNACVRYNKGHRRSPWARVWEEREGSFSVFPSILSFYSIPRSLRLGF